MTKYLYGALAVGALVAIAMTAGCKSRGGDDGCGSGCYAEACGCGCAEACGCGGCGCGCGDACGCGGCGCGCGCGGGGDVDSADAAHAMALSKQYRGWARMNADAFRSRQHGGADVLVYANGLAKETYISGSGNYPVGAVIAKIGYKNNKKKFVWLMEKRGGGYDTDNGDWWYATVMKKGVTEGGKVDSCIGCHTGADNDYVFGR